MSEQLPHNPDTGYGRMEAAAEAELKRRAQERALEARIVTPAVQALNDKAELEIYGSKNHTYLDPESGAVIASPDRPSTGKLADIRSNPAYGKTQEERDTFASVYEQEIDHLLSAGFELCQAKLVQDLREKDWPKLNELAGKFMSEGMDAKDAQIKAQRFYDKMDEKRRQLIKEKGAFTLDEYKLLRAGRRWSAPNDESDAAAKAKPGVEDGAAEPEEKGALPPTGKLPELEPGKPTEPEEPDPEQVAREKYQNEVEAYRGKLSADFMYDYAMAEQRLTELLARRERVHGVALRNTKKELVEAQASFDRLWKVAKKLSAESMKEAGLSPRAFLLHSKIDDETEKRFIALNTAAIRQDLARPKGEGRRAELTQKFYSWWVKQGGKEMSGRQRIWGKTKKVAVIAGVTLPVGIVAGAFLPIGAGAGIGAAIAYAGARSLGRGFASGKIEQNAQEFSGKKAVTLKEVESNVANVAVAQALHRMGQRQSAIDAAYGENKIADSITAEHVAGANSGARRNRRRLGTATLLGAGFGAAGAEIGGLIAGAVGGGSHVVPIHHPGSHVHHPAPPTHHPTPPHHPAPPAHGTTGQEFYVEPGSGEIREIQEYAASHNYNVTPQQAFDIYQQLYNEHGSNIIDLTGGGPSTYIIGPGDIGLSRPGMATWYPGIENELRGLLAQASAQ